jgi:hypothetical protein
MPPHDERAPNQCGQVLQIILAEKGVTAAELVRLLCKEGHNAYNELVHFWKFGYKIPDPEELNLIARVLKLGEIDRKNLHRTAAMDKGYDIGL